MDKRQLQIVLELNDQASKELKKVAGTIGDNTTNTKNWDAALKNVKRGILAVGAAAVAGLGFGVKIAADLETAEVGLTTLLGSTEEARATIERLKIEAARTPFELPGLTQATQLLTSVTKDGDRSIDILLDVGEALAAMGKGQAELDRIIVNMQQIAATGRAMSIDIRQFAFAGIPIYEMLTETTGKSGEALQELITSGGVTFDLLTNMFDEANDAGGRFYQAFANQGGTFNQALSNAKDSLGIFLADVATSTGLLDGLAGALMKVSEIMGDWRGSLEAVSQHIKDNGLAYSMLAGAIVAALIPALISATVAFGAMAAAAIAAFAAAALAAAPFLIAGALIAGAAYLIINNWSTIKEFFSDLWRTVVEATTSAMDSVSNAITSTWDSLKDFFWNVVNFIIGAYATLFDFLIPGWDTMLVDMWSKSVEYFTLIKDWIASALSFISSVWATWSTAFSQAWNLVWSSVRDYFSEMWEGITGIFTTAKDAILDIMDSLVGPIKKVIALAERALELGGKAVSKVKDSVSNAVQDIIERGSEITGRASGGPVVGGTPYIVGEKGPELFLPSVSGNIVPNHALGGQGGTTINVYGDVSGEELVDKVASAIGMGVKREIRV